LVFLIDVSGSMSDPNKLPLLKQSLKILVNELRKKRQSSHCGLCWSSRNGLQHLEKKQTIIDALENSMLAEAQLVVQE
jgi:Ca-activated chloride channel family protein